MKESEAFLKESEAHLKESEAHLKESEAKNKIWKQKKKIYFLADFRKSDLKEKFERKRSVFEREKNQKI